MDTEIYGAVSMRYCIYKIYPMDMSSQEILRNSFQESAAISRTIFFTICKAATEKSVQRIELEYELLYTLILNIDVYTVGVQIRCRSKRKRQLKLKKIIYIGNFITTHVDQHDFSCG
jgi:hypothetical protein